MTDQLGDSSQTHPIGGWLILQAIGLVLAAVVALIGSMRSLYDLVEREHLAGAAGVAQLPHSPHSLRLLILLSINAAMFVAFTWIAVRFFRRKRNVPRLMISMYGIGVLSVGAVFALGRGRALSIQDTVAPISGAAVWIPYFLVSQRVKRTFLL